MKHRHGILGLGAAGRVHAHAVAELPGFDLVAYDPSTDVRDAFQREFPECTVTDSIEDFLASSCATVSVATPHYTHFSLAKRLIIAGIGVLIEKPACLDLPSLETLVALAKENGVRCETVLQHRISEPIRWIADKVDAGVLGRPYQVEISLRCSRSDEYFASSGWRGKRRTEGGTVIVNQALHLIDLCCFLFGEPGIEASVTRLGRRCMETEDAAAALLSFPDGTLCVLAASVSTSVRWSGELGIYGSSHFVVANVGFPDSIKRSDLPVPDALRSRNDVSHRDRHEPHFRAVKEFVRGSSDNALHLESFAPALRVITGLYEKAKVIDVRGSLRI